MLLCRLCSPESAEDDITQDKNIKRIAHISPVFLPVPPQNYGGTERVIFDLATEQTRAGHDVTIYGCRTSKGDYAVAGNVDCMAVQQAALASAGKDCPPGLADAITARLIAEIMDAADRYDIIHLHGSMTFSGALQQHRHKLLRTIHWRTDHADHQQFFEYFPDEAVVAISDNQRIHIPHRNVAGRVYHGIDPARYFLDDAGGDALVFLGRMTDQKGPLRAIEIAERCGSPLLLAGDIDPGNPSYFKDHIEPRLAGDIEYIGAVGDREKQTLLGKAKALLFPINWPEPFGLVMIEAMATGTPVIGWRNGSVPEVIDDGVTGRIVSSVADAADAVAQVARLPRRDIRARFERRFDRARMAHEYDAIYHMIMAGGQ